IASIRAVIIDSFISLLSEGDLRKLDQVEKLLDFDINEATLTPFAGNLKPFNQLRTTLESKFKKRRKFPPFKFE
ncbi:MAG: hypothetical protein ACFFD7_06770, partial [Candidatus Thorarchaeota archaeon]